MMVAQEGIQRDRIDPKSYMPCVCSTERGGETRVYWWTFLQVQLVLQILPSTMIKSARSSFNGGLRTKKRYPRRKFWGYLNYQVEGGNCDFFKWVDGELDQEMEMSHTKQIEPLLEVIIGLLVLILMMVPIMVNKM
ncbi:unnamed protein product [Lactuca saligna]|uniref:Uncharacterized protein n=1 Tax=Lactuca saligna TaxID=75948 RepID=A0AA36DWV8_LACSI|nr:unnamed protein product [Lactuca saligna]